MMGRLLDCRHLCGEMTMEARVALARYLYKQEQIDTAHLSALGPVWLQAVKILKRHLSIFEVLNID